MHPAMHENSSTNSCMDIRAPTPRQAPDQDRPVNWAALLAANGPSPASQGRCRPGTSPDRAAGAHPARIARSHAATGGPDRGTVTRTPHLPAPHLPGPDGVMKIQLGPFDQAPYVADKDNPWKRRDPLGWLRTRAYAQIRRLPPLSPGTEEPWPRISMLTKKRVPWSNENSAASGTQWPGETTLLGCKLAAALEASGIGASAAAKPLGPEPETERVWDACEKRAVQILRQDPSRWGGTNRGLAEVWEMLTCNSGNDEHIGEISSGYVFGSRDDMSADMWGATSGILRRIVWQIFVVAQFIIGTGFVYWMSMPPGVGGDLRPRTTWSTITIVTLVSILVERETIRRTNSWIFATSVTATIGTLAGVVAADTLPARLGTGDEDTANLPVWVATLAIIMVVLAVEHSFVMAGNSFRGMLAEFRSDSRQAESGDPAHIHNRLSVLLAPLASTAIAFAILLIVVKTGYVAVRHADSHVAVVVAAQILTGTFVASLLFALPVALTSMLRETRNSTGAIGALWEVVLLDAHRTRQRRLPAEQWLDDRLGLAVTGAIWTVLGASGRIPVPESPLLIEVDKTAELVPTPALERVWNDVRSHQTAAVAVVGERGTGKTALVDTVLDQCTEVSRQVELDSVIKRPGAVQTCRLIVPGDYSAPDFVSYAAREIVDKVRKQVWATRPLKDPRRIGIIWIWLVVLHVILSALVDLASLSPFSTWLKHASRTHGDFVASSLFTLAFLGSAALVMLLAGGAISIFRDPTAREDLREWRASKKEQHRSRLAVLRSAEYLKQDLTWLRKRSTSMSGEIAPGLRSLAILGGRSFAQRTEERTALALTYTEIVRRLRELLQKYSEWAKEFENAYRRIHPQLQPHSASNNDPAGSPRKPSDHLADVHLVPSLVIIIDEMDKIMRPDDRTTAVNHIKDLFRIPHVKFVVTIADDYDRYRFMRYGVSQTGTRDPYDSAFDDIIQINECDPLTATQILTRRVPGFPAPLALLAYIVSAGHPRDMIRTARYALDEFRREENRQSATTDAEAKDVRSNALKYAITAVCEHERKEFAALLASLDEFVARPPAAGGRAGSPPRLSPQYQRAEDRMSAAMELAQSFVAEYADDHQKGWATPDLIHGLDAHASAGTALQGARPSEAPEQPETWRKLDDCVTAENLAQQRTDAVETARALGAASLNDQLRHESEARGVSMTNCPFSPASHEPIAVRRATTAA